MNRINGYVTQHPEAYEYYIEWEEFNVNQQANTSSVRATSYIRCNSHSSWANGKTQKLWINGRQFSNTLNISLNPGSVVQLCSGTVDNIAHNWDGTLSFGIAASGDLPSGSGYGPLWGEAKQTVFLTQIPRQANFNAIEIQNIALDKFDVYYKVDKNLSSIQYKLNNGNWQSINVVWGNWATEARFRIENLNVNTRYSIQLKANANGIDTYSGTYNVTTYDIARFKTLNNFVFGDAINISKTNPSYSTNYLTMRCNNKDIITRRYIDKDSFTITLTQTELDNLYKALTSFSQRIDFVLITNNGSKDWTTSKQITCTFKGNQKTINYYTADRTRKRAKIVYYTADGISKKAVLIYKKDGKWRRCI